MVETVYFFPRLSVYLKGIRKWGYSVYYNISLVWLKSSDVSHPSKWEIAVNRYRGTLATCEVHSAFAETIRSLVTGTWHRNNSWCGPCHHQRPTKGKQTSYSDIPWHWPQSYVFDFIPSPFILILDLCLFIFKKKKSQYSNSTGFFFSVLSFPSSLLHMLMAELSCLGTGQKNVFGGYWNYISSLCLNC